MSSEEIELLLKKFRDTAVTLHTMSGLPEDDDWKVKATARFNAAKAELVAALS